MGGKVIRLRFISQNKKEPGELGFTCGSIYKTGGTVHGRSLLVCLAQQHGALRKRERDGIWFGNRHTHYTWESWKHKQERQRNENKATRPSVGWGHPGKPPALVRALVGAHHPAHHMLGFLFQWGLVGGRFPDQAWRQHGILKRALEISEMGLPCGQRLGLCLLVQGDRFDPWSRE